MGNRSDKRWTKKRDEHLMRLQLTESNALLEEIFSLREAFMLDDDTA